ncbi:hypothetical protein THERMOT_681 [Bathymodiolus thermophilus thioautotrophic gill symbiont]|nr:hypothetical protein THERMOT_681 [Bathymodiolus thermophilus thioautotrophic gill symbiont]
MDKIEPALILSKDGKFTFMACTNEPNHTSASININFA